MNSPCGVSKVFVTLSSLLCLAAPAAGGVGKWTSGGPVAGAYVASLAVGPGSPGTVYASAGSGDRYRLYTSADGGENWLESGEGLPADGNPFGLEADPRDASTVYVLVEGRGLFKSADRGARWAASNAGLTEEQAAGTRAFALDPRSSSRLYLAASGELFRSANAGASWARVQVPEFRVDGITIDPRDSSVLYVTGFGYLPETGPAGVMKSVDGGVTWIPAAGGLQGSRIENLVIDPRDSRTLYGVAAVGFFFSNRLYKSTDGGASWTASGEDLPGDGIGALRFDPLRLSSLYAATYPGGLFESVDSGETWIARSSGLTNTLLFALAFGTTPGTLYVGSVGGGISKSNDGGESWRALPLDFPSRILALAADSTGAVVYAGTLAGVFRSTTSGASWEPRNAGLPRSDPFASALAVDPFDPLKVHAAIYDKGLFRSSDGGESWTAAGAGPDAAEFTALIVDPETLGTLYCATEDQGIFKSVDGGESWSPSGLSSSHVSALAIDPQDPATLYAGTWDGVFRSDDSAGSWTLAASDAKFVTAIAVDRSTPARVYVKGPNELLWSEDRGATWTRVESFPQGPYINALAVSPAHSSTVYATTDRGVFRTTDAGLTWAPYGTDLQRSVFALAIDATGTVLHAGAFGVWDYVEPCAPSDGSLCLLGARFRATLRAEQVGTGRSAAGRAIPQDDRFGYFSLPDLTGDAAFPEVFVKMLDATSLPGGRFWIFHTGLTDLQYTLTVRDVATGAVRQYRNDRSDPAALCGGADTSAFLRVARGPDPMAAGKAAVSSNACVPGIGALCLLSGRFRATLSAADPATSRTSSGRAISQADRFGYFSLPDFTGDAAFPEVFIKMLDATSFDGHFWVFHSGLTSLPYTLTVTDLATGEAHDYRNQTGDPTRLCGGADTAAFRN